MTNADRVLNVVHAHPGLTTIDYAEMLLWPTIDTLVQLWNLEVTHRLTVTPAPLNHALPEPMSARWWPREDDQP